MSIQTAIDVLTPIAKVELISLAMLPYALIAALGLGCAFAIAAILSEGHDQVKDEDRD
jgi:hypothetical protein